MAYVNEGFEAQPTDEAKIVMGYAYLAELYADIAPGVTKGASSVDRTLILTTIETVTARLEKLEQRVARKNSVSFARNA